MNEDITRQTHYTYSNIEPFDVIDAWGLDYYLGCVLKYICRHKHKGNPKQDLEKAKFYLEESIRRIK